MNQKAISLFGRQEKAIVKKWTMEDDIIHTSTGNVPVVHLVIVMCEEVFTFNDQLDPYYHQFVDWLHQAGFHVGSGAHGYNQEEGSFAFLFTIEATTQEQLYADLPALPQLPH